MMTGTAAICSFCCSGLWWLGVRSVGLCGGSSVAKKKTPESELLGLCIDWLAANRILAFRMNTGAIKIDKRFLRFGVPGMADILAFRKVNTIAKGPQFWPTTAVWLELKSPKGIQSDLQKSFQEKVEAEDHRYAVVRSLEDLIEAME